MVQGLIVPIFLTNQGLSYLGLYTVNFFDLWLYFMGNVLSSFLLISRYDCWAVDLRHASANQSYILWGKY